MINIRHMFLHMKTISVVLVSNRNSSNKQHYCSIHHISEQYRSLEHINLQLKCKTSALVLVSVKNSDYFHLMLQSVTTHFTVYFFIVSGARKTMD